MELELREADVHRLEHGDLIVVKFKAISQEAFEHITETLKFQAEKIQQTSGKTIHFMIAERDTELIHYRPVDKEEGGG